MSVPLSYLYSEEYVRYRGLIMARLDSILTMNYNYFNMNIPSQNAIVTRIENSIYNSTKRKYKDGTDRLVFTMDEDFINCYSVVSYNIINYINNNPDFQVKLLASNELQTNIGFANPEHLVPEYYDNIINIIKARTSQTIDKKFSSLYKCPKCHINRAEIEVVQMRSFDEPPNISAQCAECNHRWTMG